MNMDSTFEILRKLNEIKLTIISMQQNANSNAQIHEKLNKIIEMNINISRITQVEQQIKNLYISCQKLERKMDKMVRQFYFEETQAGEPTEEQEQERKSTQKNESTSGNMDEMEN